MEEKLETATMENELEKTLKTFNGEYAYIIPIEPIIVVST